MTDSDLAALKKAMADAHPDRGGTTETFIEAHNAYLAAKWMREEDAAAALREEAEASAADEERRRKEAAGAAARFRELAAKAIICACSAMLLVFAVGALYKKRPVTTDAGRHGDLAAASTMPVPQFASSKPHDASGSVQEPLRDDRPVSGSVAAAGGAGSAVPDSPRTSGENSSADEPRPAAAVAAKEVESMIRPAGAEPSTPEQQAKSTVYAAMAAANTGSIEDTSNCYADAVTYYGKRMSKAEVIADNMKLWQRWPARNYTIRPDSLTANCYVIRRGTMWMNCDVTGVFDWAVANSNRRSVGSASITWTLIGLSNSGLPDLRIVDENSTVITRTITDIGKQRAPRTAAPS